jgi:cytidyltransferase-like protein
MSETIVLISGGFDPIHSGHVAYIHAAMELSLGGLVIVGLNSDEWLRRKKGSEFMTWDERAAVLGAFEDVDFVVSMDDSDDTACDLIRKAKKMYPGSHITFGNGGDRSSAAETPENELCSELGVHTYYGLGGENKANSSSWILKKWETFQAGD